jgi:muramoyltetrapeptide carboxypeptidase
MPISFPDATEQALENLRQALFGELTEFASVEESDVAEVTGCVMGGNLSVLYSLLGSHSLRNTSGVILFIEDVDEMLYHLDRMLWGLYRAGFLSNVKAIVCGGFTQMKDNTKAFGFQADNPWGGDERAIIRSMADRLQVPVAFGFPAGHLSDNRAFYLGQNVTLKTVKGYPVLSYQQP